MKSLRRVLIPAQKSSGNNAFYALTQLLCGGYLIASLALPAAIHCIDYESPTGIVSIGGWCCFAGLGAAGLGLCWWYYLRITLDFFRNHITFRNSRNIYIYFFLSLLFTIFIGCLTTSPVAAWLFLSAFFTIFLPLSAGTQCWKITVSVIVTRCMAVGMMLIPYLLLVLMLDGSAPGISDSLRKSFLNVMSALQENSGISTDGVMSAWIGCGLFLYLLWYVETARFYARLDGVKLRTLFSRGVLLWYAVAVAIFLLFSLLTIRAGERLNGALAALEHRFDRPLNVENLAELYFRDESPDAEFWKRFRRLLEEMERSNSDTESSDYPLDFIFPYETPNALEPGNCLFAPVREKFEETTALRTQLEEMFAGPIPPDAREYRPGRLLTMGFRNLSGFLRFCEYELWRMYFALADGNPEQALEADRLIRRAARELRRETFPGLLTWRRCEELRLTGIEMLLESNLISDAELQRIHAELEETENAVAQVYEQLLYGEAVFALDCCERLANGSFLLPYDDRQSPQELTAPFPLRAARFFLPQFRYFWRLEKAALAEVFSTKNADAEEAPGAAGRKNAQITSPGTQFLRWTLAPAVSIYQKSFNSFVAHCRATRGLIQAEQYRRLHGSWPESLPDLPPDPFSGAPLLYRSGKCVVETVDLVPSHPDAETVFGKLHPREVFELQRGERTIPAVQIWSVGENRRDDDGRRGGAVNQRFRDDIRAVLRIPETAETPEVPAVQQLSSAPATP